MRATLRVEQQVNEHRRYPMLDMKQEYAGGGELLETAFMYTHFHVYQELPQPEGRGLISGRGGFVQHDLPFFVQYSVDPKTMKIRGFVQHDAGRVNAEQGRRIGRYYGRVLSAMLQEPEGRVGSEELLLGEDRAWLEEANRTGQEYEVESCVDELFEEQARRRPEAVAVECEGRRMATASCRGAASGWRRSCGVAESGWRHWWECVWRGRRSWWWRCWESSKPGRAMCRWTQAIRWNGWRI